MILRISPRRPDKQAEVLGSFSQLLLEILEWHLNLDTTVSLKIRPNSLLIIHCSQTEVLGGFSQLLLEILEWHLNLNIDSFFKNPLQFIINCSLFTNWGFVRFFSVTPRNIGMTPQFGHDSSLKIRPNSLLIIHCSQTEVLGGFSQLLLEILEWHLNLNIDSFFKNPSQFIINYSLFTDWGFVRFFSVTPRNIGMTPQFGHDSFFTDPFQFIIHCSHTEVLGFREVFSLTPR